jgi:hypothetical protein
MVKAEDLINQQKEREKIKFITFNKIFSNIEKKIVKASSTNFYYVWYEVPQYLIGYPQYNFNDCFEYLINKLKTFYYINNFLAV